MESLQLIAHGSRKMITFKHLVSVWVSVKGLIIYRFSIHRITPGSRIGELALGSVTCTTYPRWWCH